MTWRAWLLGLFLLAGLSFVALPVFADYADDDDDDDDDDDYEPPTIDEGLANYGMWLDEPAVTKRRVRLRVYARLKELYFSIRRKSSAGDHWIVTPQRLEEYAVSFKTDEFGREYVDVIDTCVPFGSVTYYLAKEYHDGYEFLPLYAVYDGNILERFVDIESGENDCVQDNPEIEYPDFPNDGSDYEFSMAVYGLGIAEVKQVGLDVHLRVDFRRTEYTVNMDRSHDYSDVHELLPEGQLSDLDEGVLQFDEEKEVYFVEIVDECVPEGWVLYRAFKHFSDGHDDDWVGGQEHTSDVHGTAEECGRYENPGYGDGDASGDDGDSDTSEDDDNGACGCTVAGDGDGSRVGLALAMLIVGALALRRGRGRS
ncbi:MAG: hypothetical protein H6684_04285 [Deltaproteobacteria bacterium]|nr:hypothetical protein [Deltaproteobacteria bacterium]